MASLSLANARSIACFTHETQLVLLASSKAAVILTTPVLAHHCKRSCITVLCVPSVAERLLSLFSVNEERMAFDNARQNIHASAVISADVILGRDVFIDAHAVISKGVILGDGCIIGAHVFLGEHTTLHDEVTLSPGVTLLSHTIIGKNSKIDSGAIIGSKPYNPVKSQGKWNLNPPVGRVMIGEEVHIGANTTIDRGVFGDTLIGDGVVIDNLVHIAHDVMIAEQTVIAACAIVGAYTVIGEHCTIGGGCSIAGQLTIANDTVLTGRTTVSRSLLKPGIYSSGVTAQPHDTWRRNVARFHRLDASIKKLRKLKKT